MRLLRLLWPYRMHLLRLFATLLLATILAANHSAAAETTAPDFSAVLTQHLKRYPGMELQDYYKLLVQACLGSEHAVGDTEAATHWMERELATMGPGPDEPLFDPISPDGRLVRVHLRPFVAQKGDPARLVAAFVQTANTDHGSSETLAAAWMQLVALTESRTMPFTPEAAREYGRKMAAAGWPAVRHSKTFRERYQPAYRVVSREQLAGLMPEARQ